MSKFNDEGMTKSKYKSRMVRSHSCFEPSFLRHLSFDIRHFPPSFSTEALLPHDANPS